MFAEQEAVSGPLGYADVAARALKYNLDYRLKAMEGVLSQGLLDVSRWDMFPRVLANAGYVTRSPVDASRTRQIETGVESPTHQTSSERNRAIASAELSWNLLDFGVSYYRAKQQADQVMIAEERKRKVVQNILADTRNAYWRALGAQRLSGRIDALLARSEAALERAREIEAKGLMPQPQVLAYQRALLDAIVLLQYRRQELELAKQELGALMNLAPGHGVHAGRCAGPRVAGGACGRGQAGGRGAGEAPGAARGGLPDADHGRRGEESDRVGAARGEPGRLG
jgi:outer membrane protein TolC